MKQKIVKAASDLILNSSQKLPTNVFAVSAIIDANYRNYPIDHAATVICPRQNPVTKTKFNIETYSSNTNAVLSLMPIRQLMTMTTSSSDAQTSSDNPPVEGSSSYLEMMQAEIPADIYLYLLAHEIKHMQARDSFECNEIAHSESNVKAPLYISSGFGSIPADFLKFREAMCKKFNCDNGYVYVNGDIYEVTSDNKIGGLAKLNQDAIYAETIDNPEMQILFEQRYQQHLMYKVQEAQQNLNVVRDIASMAKNIAADKYRSDFFALWEKFKIEPKLSAVPKDFVPVVKKVNSTKGPTSSPAPGDMDHIGKREIYNDWNKNGSYHD